MFSHIFTSVSDFGKAFTFYSALMEALDIELRWCDASRPWAGWHSQGKTRPYFVICKPFDGYPHEPGNGQMLAFMAESREMVRRGYLAALANGGLDEGEPGPRPEYHEFYYGAYFRDPDGNKLCVSCHEPEESDPR